MTIAELQERIARAIGLAGLVHAPASSRRARLAAQKRRSLAGQSWPDGYLQLANSHGLHRFRQHGNLECCGLLNDRGNSGPVTPMYAAATPIAESFTMASAAKFTITSVAGSETIPRGVLAAFALELKSVDGFDAKVTLSCSGEPAGSQCTDLPQIVKVNGTAVAISRIPFPARTTPGTYIMTFTGTSVP